MGKALKDERDRVVVLARAQDLERPLRIAGRNVALALLFAQARLRPVQARPREWIGNVATANESGREHGPDCPPTRKGWFGMRLRLILLIGVLSVLASFLGDGTPWPVL